MLDILFDVENQPRAEQGLLLLHMSFKNKNCVAQTNSYIIKQSNNFFCNLDNLKPTFFSNHKVMIHQQQIFFGFAYENQIEKLTIGTWLNFDEEEQIDQINVSA